MGQNVVTDQYTNTVIKYLHIQTNSSKHLTINFTQIFTSCNSPAYITDFSTWPPDLAVSCEKARSCISGYSRLQLNKVGRCPKRCNNESTTINNDHHGTMMGAGRK